MGRRGLWVGVVVGAHGVSVRDSGDPEHGKVLELRAEGDGVIVLARDLPEGS